MVMISTVFITKEIASIQIVKHILSAFETVSVHHLKPVGENQGISNCLFCKLCFKNDRSEVAAFYLKSCFPYFTSD